MRQLKTNFRDCSNDTKYLNLSYNKAIYDERIQSIKDYLFVKSLYQIN